jgi:ornithine cyclodeaminase/alanine dehydrogenase-like protein (mu-crystallin family)
MSKLLFLTDDEVRQTLNLDELLTHVEHALRSVTSRTASVPARTRVFVPSGRLVSMLGFVPGLGVGGKLLTTFPGNGRHNSLPVRQGVVVLFDENTGQPTCVMSCGYLTAMRTAAVSAIATRLLADPPPRSLAILGAGAQARSHLQILTHLWQFHDIRIASRHLAHAQNLAKETPGAVAVSTWRDAVRGADLVCGCADTTDPVILRSWLKPGVHVNSVGGYHGREVDEELVRDAQVYVESTASLEPLPDGVRELQGLRHYEVTELGVLLMGGRPSPAASGITLLKSTGHAAEDIAAARHVFDRARDRGVGRVVEL